GREYAATYRGVYVPEFRFYEYCARAYHPDLGRFITEVPKLFDARDYNLFRYFHNVPVDFFYPLATEPPWASSSRGAAPKQAENRAYNDRMAALQRSPRASLNGGTIAAGMVGQALMQQARREAQGISEGKENRSTAPQNLYRSHAKPLAPGLVVRVTGTFQ